MLYNALHSETLEHLVVYRETETGEIWARPATMFLDNLPNGAPRFVLQGSSHAKKSARTNSGDGWED